MKKFLLLVVLAALAVKPSFSQVDNKFDYIDEKAINAFAQPLVTSLGVAMNSASYHSAHIPSTFGFSIGVRAMVMFIPDDQKTFTPDLPAGYKSVSGSNATATFLGSDGAIYSGPNGFLTYPSGINQSNLPFAFPQATVSLLGTEVLVRYAPLKIKSDDGAETKITLFGLGLRHSISRYIPFCPVDIAVQVLYNKFEIGDLASSKNMAYGAQVSKTFGLLSLYGGLQFEKSNVNFDYTTKVDPENPLLQSPKHVTADIDGNNKTRLTVGTSLSLGVLMLNADYSLGSQAVASAGLTFEF
ncbi:MAG TPA: DUF6588 family protein [Bacteroidota bacterium]|nr:DUF6588 family protein [Bacteroidota bacterium]